MASNYAIIMHYSTLGGTRSQSKCVGTVNSRKKAVKYAKLLKMTGNIETEIKKQKHKISRDYRLNYAMNPDNENKIRIEAIGMI